MRVRALILITALATAAALASTASADSPPTTSSPPTFSEHTANDPIPPDVFPVGEDGGGTACDYSVTTELLYAPPTPDGKEPGPLQVLATDLTYAEPSSCKNSGSVAPLMKQTPWPPGLEDRPGWYDQRSTTTSVICMGQADGTVDRCSQPYTSYLVESAGGTTRTSNCWVRPGWATFEEGSVMQGSETCPESPDGGPASGPVKVTGWLNPVTRAPLTVVPKDDARCGGKSQGGQNWDARSAAVYICSHADAASINDGNSFGGYADTYAAPVFTVNVPPCARSSAWTVTAPDGDGGPLVRTSNAGNVDEWAGQHEGRADCQVPPMLFSLSRGPRIAPPGGPYAGDGTHPAWESLAYGERIDALGRYQVDWIWTIQPCPHRWGAGTPNELDPAGVDLSACYPTVLAVPQRNRTERICGAPGADPMTPTGFYGWTHDASMFHAEGCASAAPPPSPAPPAPVVKPSPKPKAPPVAKPVPRVPVTPVSRSRPIAPPPVVAGPLPFTGDQVRRELLAGSLLLLVGAGLLLATRPRRRTQA